MSGNHSVKALRNLRTDFSERKLPDFFKSNNPKQCSRQCGVATIADAEEWPEVYCEGLQRKRKKKDKNKCGIDPGTLKRDREETASRQNGRNVFDCFPRPIRI
jgi:hypothetical protein